MNEYETHTARTAWTGLSPRRSTSPCTWRSTGRSTSPARRSPSSPVRKIRKILSVCVCLGVSLRVWAWVCGWVWVGVILCLMVWVCLGLGVCGVCLGRYHTHVKFSHHPHPPPPLLLIIIIHTNQTPQTPRQGVPGAERGEPALRHPRHPRVVLGGGPVGAAVRVWPLCGFVFDEMCSCQRSDGKSTSLSRPS